MTARPPKTASKRQSRVRRSLATASREPPRNVDTKHALLLRRAALDTAARLFAEHGYAGVSLQDVADALGISRQGLYYYFPRKENLLEALVEEVTFSSERQSSQIAERTDVDAATALRLVTQTHARWLLEHSLPFRVVDRSENDLPQRLRERHDEAKRVVLDNFTRIIEQGIGVGQFRPIDARVAAFSIIGMCSWTAWWFRSDGRRSEEDVAEMLGDMAVNGLLRIDAHRSRSDQIGDVLRILKEDVHHLERLWRG
jgi:AcrR family transcriptional regulator